jgi:hypothetical protein
MSPDFMLNLSIDYIVNLYTLSCIRGKIVFSPKGERGNVCSLQLLQSTMLRICMPTEVVRQHSAEDMHVD